ncbi:MAG TPA: diacylglycerol kinase family protein [Gemmataceae bacterium]|nr:diacylglycerol kinase family protein [Gemmataceae bacterium]
MKVHLIHNPKAGGASGPDADELVKAIRQAGHEVTYQSSQKAHWQETLDKPADLLAVAGGDGIVGKVARLCLNRAVPIAVLPMGTANNIAKTLGLMDLPLEQLIAGWATGHRQGFDVGVADGPWGREFFVEGLGTGLFGSALFRLETGAGPNPIASNDPDKELQAARQYLVEHLQSYPAQTLQIKLDDEELSGDYLLVEIMNIRSIGPNVVLAPEADSGDGLLDFVIVSARARDALMEQIQDQSAEAVVFSGLAVHRGRHLQIWGKGLHVHIDDRVWPEDDAKSSTSPFLIKAGVLAQALSFLVPAKKESAD